MPSSLTEVLPSVLGYSPRLPVLVSGTDDFGCSTEDFLVSASDSSSKRGLLPLSALVPVFYPRQAVGRTGNKFPFAVHAPSLLCFEPSKIGAGILTCHPSPTPFGLGLGSDLPWADLPAPGNLRLSTNEIPTRFTATRSGSITSIQSRRRHRRPSTRYGTLPYHVSAAAQQTHP